MSRTVELEGQSVGRKSANKAKDYILAARSIDELGKLAGQRLRAILDDERFVIENTYAKASSWQVGFIDGWLDRATELREEIK